MVTQSKQGHWVSSITNGHVHRPLWTIVLRKKNRGHMQSIVLRKMERLLRALVQCPFMYSPFPIVRRCLKEKNSINFKLVVSQTCCWSLLHRIDHKKRLSCSWMRKVFFFFSFFFFVYDLKEPESCTNWIFPLLESIALVLLVLQQQLQLELTVLLAYRCTSSSISKN